MASTIRTIKKIQNGAATLSYIRAGSDAPDAVTVCMIASTGRGPEDFIHLADHLAAAGLRVAMPWPRGMGGSEGPLQDIDFHDLAADAAAVLRAEKGHGRGIVTGHAYGCWIARTLAQDSPDLVDGLILLAAGAGNWSPELSQAIDIAMDPAAAEADRLAALRLAFFAEGHDPRLWLDGWNGDVVRAQRAARSRTDRDSWWASGTVPILDIVGRQDPFRPAEHQTFYQKEFSPRVTLRLIDGASHALPDEKPEEVAQQMLDWIGRL